MGANADELGPRFTDLTDVWSPRLRERLHAAAASEGIRLDGASTPACWAPTTRPRRRSGCSVPSAPTRSGMSTVLEAIAARWVGLEVCGVSLVTNAGAGYTGQPLTHEEVLEAGAVAGPRLARVLRRFITEL